MMLDGERGENYKDGVAHGACFQMEDVCEGSQR